MMDLQTIHELSADASLNAKRRQLIPLVLEPHQLDIEHIRQAPSIGTYVPPGWKRVNLADWHGPQSPHGVYYGDAKGNGAYLVDASGFGEPGEPALTVDELVEQLRPGFGYAIIEEGMFQVKIGVFRRVQ